MIDHEIAGTAAEQANKLFGQWMPQRWLNLFIDAYDDIAACRAAQPLMGVQRPEDVAEIVRSNLTAFFGGAPSHVVEAMTHDILALPHTGQPQEGGDNLIVPTNPCLKKLCVDEPFFVLLGRDEQAPMAVERWADYRAAAEGKSEWTEQAREVANSMRAYRIARKAGLASTLPAAAPASPQRAEGEWQPIETAPKDGTPVLLAGGTLESLVHDRAGINDKCIRASWHEYRFCSEPAFRSIWLVDCTDDGEVQICDPTHWRPLPAPPVIAEPKPIVAEERGPK